jgi:hypothetical protein
MTDLALRPQAATSSPLSWALSAPASLVLLAWALFIATSRFDWHGIGVQFSDTDDAMRLVEIRDFLAGQGWFDVHQYRLDPPSTAPMHWSRLVDLPQALLMLALGSVLPAQLATKITMFIWPPLTLIPALFAARRLAIMAGGPLAALPGVLLTVWLMPATWQFAPGRIDHHNVQIALTLWLLVAAGTPGTVAAALAGLASAAMLAVGMETLPYVGVAAALAAMRFIVDPRQARDVATYGASLATATLGFYVLTIPPGRWAVAACDALSSSYFVLACVGGCGLALAASWRPVGETAWRRIASVALVGAVAVAAFGAVEPACLRGPFGQIDPAIGPIWLDRVQEVQPITVSWRDNALATLVTLAMPVFGLLSALALLFRRAPTRLFVGALGLCVAISLAIGCVQVRTLVYANILAVPLVAGAVGALAGRVQRLGGSPVSAVLAGSLLASSIVTLLVASLIPGLASTAGAEEKSRAEAVRANCYDSANYGALAGEPPGLVANFVDSGPFILVATHHAVLSAPYHRASRGILDGYAFFKATPEKAHAYAQRRGVRYVVYCTASGYVGHYKATAPDGLAARLDRGDSPDWLEPVGDAKGPVRIFRVRNP